LFSLAPSKDSSSSGGKKTLEPLYSPFSVQFSPFYSLSPIYPAEVKLPLTRNGSQKDSRSGKEALKEDDGVHDLPQDNLEDSVNSIRFRRRFSHDID